MSCTGAGASVNRLRKDKRRRDDKLRRVLMASVSPSVACEGEALPWLKVPPRQQAFQDGSLATRLSCLETHRMPNIAELKRDKEFVSEQKSTAVSVQSWIHGMGTQEFNGTFLTCHLLPQNPLC
ncbi:hypothetical protein JOB18_004257 [Solea senegalensis]|uniref:Uncharacterized protein n=1 Tax=Solea senegalensis TaxID=28829 RepID=A0AAV6RWQ5_SOLSE|nr:hypothetical protein JOB18_004257 [Solea senegalensis]